MNKIKRYNKTHLYDLKYLIRILNYYTNLFDCKFYYKVILKLLIKYIYYNLGIAISLKYYFNHLFNINRIFKWMNRSRIFKLISKSKSFYSLFLFYFKLKQKYFNFNIYKNEYIFLNKLELDNVKYNYDSINNNNYFFLNKKKNNKFIIKLILFNTFFYSYFIALFILWLNYLLSIEKSNIFIKFRNIYLYISKFNKRDKYFIKRFRLNRFYLFYKYFLYSYKI
jgi:hypothetical protein